MDSDLREMGHSRTKVEVTGRRGLEQDLTETGHIWTKVEATARDKVVRALVMLVAGVNWKMKVPMMMMKMIPCLVNDNNSFKSFFSRDASGATAGEPTLKFARTFQSGFEFEPPQSPGPLRD
ncbi:hypothetical protein PoB_006607600 [Plakobranchus ocellatus]|uniref:Uncharacterized protein n=1 Tax=Plakobranchus ocellatus TaxID=259542 RepID=A0AAV4D6K2_9GAST|nr:hypothetical protein PoB_006607600 [Plakobranchus ocellatus]